jgi:hypothetical protein
VATGSLPLCSGKFSATVAKNLSYNDQGISTGGTIMKAYPEITSSPRLTSVEPVDARVRDVQYRPPQLFVIGKTVELIQQSAKGKDSDGYGGWYVYK